jgi:hypothetical protein
MLTAICWTNQCWGGGILFVLARMLLSLAFGFPYLFRFYIPHALLAKMASTAITPCHVMFRMDEMGSCYVFRERQHAIVLQYKPRQNALDCLDTCLEVPRFAEESDMPSHVTFLEQPDSLSWSRSYLRLVGSFPCLQQPACGPTFWTKSISPRPPYFWHTFRVIRPFKCTPFKDVFT